MPLQIRRPIEIELDPAPREREDRKQRTRLAEEMKKNFRRMVEERSERNRQLLREQRLRERGERPPSGPLRELAEAFAPPPSGAFQEAPLSAFPQLEEQRVQRGAEGARQFAEEVRGRPLEEVARIMGLAEVARQRGATPQQLVAQPSATEFERVGLQLSIDRETIPAFQKLAPVTAGKTIAEAINPFALEQKYIAKHTTPKFQAAFRATLGEALQAVGVPEERANQASDIGGVLLGQVALPTSVVPFVGTGGKLVKVLRAVTLGAGLSAAQEDAFIREFEGRDPELWEILLAAGAGGGGAGVIESGAIGAGIRRLRPGAVAGEAAEEVAPVAAREAVPRDVAPALPRRAAEEVEIVQEGNRFVIRTDDPGLPGRVAFATREEAERFARGAVLEPEMVPRFGVGPEPITRETRVPPAVSRTSPLQGQQLAELPPAQLELPFPRTRNAQEIAGLAGERRINSQAVREGAATGANTVDDVFAAEADLSAARQADNVARVADVEDLTKTSFDDLITEARRVCRG